MRKRPMMETGMKYPVTFPPCTAAAGAMASDHSPVISTKTVIIAGTFRRQGLEQCAGQSMQIAGGMQTAV